MVSSDIIEMASALTIKEFTFLMNVNLFDVVDIFGLFVGCFSSFVCTPVSLIALSFPCLMFTIRKKSIHK